MKLTSDMLLFVCKKRENGDLSNIVLINPNTYDPSVTVQTTFEQNLDTCH